MVKDVHSIHGTNMQDLVEKIIRTRIFESKYWKEECFGLTAELVVDKTMELGFVSGVYGGNIKPTPFLCLTLKMFQIQPEKDIIVEFIKNEDFKKIKSQNRNGEFELMHVDEFVDELLHSERVCDIILPRLQKRYVLEEAEQLELQVSALEEDMDDVESIEEEEEEDEKLERVPSPDHREATETWTSPIALPHCATGEVEAGLPEGQVGRQNGGALPLTERSIGARVQDITAAGPEIDGTDPAPSPSVITIVIDTGATQNLLKDLRKATRRAREEMSNGLSLGLVQRASCKYEVISLCGRTKIYSHSSYKNILGRFCFLTLQ
uniref:Pre-mRNA-splicing factor 38B n=1 Tax=Myotis myotis TaxID=51298 RepID=A0A7J7Z483_MYOMY|nr:hypothetical protein mMyoMyo1_010482 [Myotis myotis]